MHLPLTGSASETKRKEEAPAGNKVGGIDFGFRNPLAAVWGVVGRDDVLWYADPTGAMEISELRCADIKVRKGDNSLRPGIAAVTARLNDGRLKVLEGRCPHLVAEAGLYRYSAETEERGDETPVDDHNHALGALRYLVSRL